MAATDASDASIAQLSRSAFEVRPWINAALDAIPPVEADSSAAADEARVAALLHRVVAHRQHVNATVEDIISQTTVRLPRATLELSRMAQESQELRTQLQSISDKVAPLLRPTADADAATPRTTAPAGDDGGVVEEQAYVGRLRALRTSHVKLQRCTTVINKVLRVDALMQQLNTEVKQLQRGDVGSATVSVASVAAVVGEVKALLGELCLFDPHYGTSQRESLHQYEQFVEKALEEDCVRSLTAHDVQIAAERLQSLKAIGREECVLQRYAINITSSSVESMKRLLGQSGGTANNRPPSLADAAMLLRQRIMPDILATLQREADFIAKLEQATLKHPQQPSSSGQANDVSEEKKTSELPAALQHCIDALTSSLRDCLTSPLQRATNNDDVLACLEALRGAFGAPTASLVHDDDSSLLARTSAAAQRAMLAVVASADGVAPAFVERIRQRVESEVLLLASAEPIDFVGEGRTHTSSAGVAEYDGLAAAMARGGTQLLLFVGRREAEAALHVWRQLLEEKLLASFAPPSPWPAGVPVRPAYLLAILARMELRAKAGLHLCRNQLEAALRSSSALHTFGVDGSSTAEDLVMWLATNVWEPLRLRLSGHASDLERLVMDALLQPLTEKVSGYRAMPLWVAAHSTNVSVAEMNASPTCSSSSPLLTTAYSAGGAAQSPSVRDLGEAIMELPLTLESLCSRASSHQEAEQAWLEQLTMAWLVNLAEGAVSDFVESQVLPTRMDFVVAGLNNNNNNKEEGASIASSGIESHALHQLSAAWMRLRSDLEYLRDILSAVSEDRLTQLEEVVEQLQALPPPSTAELVAPFTVREMLARHSVHRARSASPATAA